MARIEIPNSATSIRSLLENVVLLWESKMVGRGGGDRSSLIVEILTLNFFTHCLQHNVAFGPKIRGADGKPSGEFHIVQGTRRVPQAESELSKPLPEGSNFRPIATQFHTAPATSVILAGVVEPKDTFGIFTLTDCWVVGRSEEVGGMARYGDQ